MRAHPKPVELPLPGGGEPGTTVTVHPLLAATMPAPPDLISRPKGPLGIPRAFMAPRRRWIDLPIPAFLVQHPTAGAILVDTGFHPSVVTDPAENLGRLGNAIYTVKMSPEDVIPAQIAERGVVANDVRFVLMTHLHFDHASGVSQFPGATFVTAELEWANAIKRGGALKGFHPPQFDHDYDWRAIDWSASYVAGHASFGRGVDVFGDGSIHLLHTPGHTPGHMSVLLQLEGRRVLLTGDATYAIRTIDENLVPIFVDDMHDYLRSVAEIRNFRELEPDAVIIPGHDAETWPSVEPVYT